MKVFLIQSYIRIPLLSEDHSKVSVHKDARDSGNMDMATSANPPSLQRARTGCRMK